MPTVKQEHATAEQETTSLVTANGINPSQMAGVLRILITYILSTWGAKYIPSDAMGPLTEHIVNIMIGVFTTGAMLWSYYSNSKPIQIDRVANMSNVKVIVADPQMANITLAANPKVISVPEPAVMSLLTQQHT